MTLCCAPAACFDLSMVCTARLASASRVIYMILHHRSYSVRHSARYPSPSSMPPRSQHALSLPEAQDIVLQDSELRQVLLELARRSAGGAAKGGRYNKHDTARLRFIRDKAFMGLRLGIMVPEADMRMIRMPPQEQLRKTGGADWAAMEEWAQRHGRDPRSGKDGPLTDTEQQTLLRWFSRNISRFAEPTGARRGAPVDAKIGESIPGSVYRDFTVSQLAAAGPLPIAADVLRGEGDATIEEAEELPRPLQEAFERQRKRKGEGVDERSMKRP